MARLRNLQADTSSKQVSKPNPNTTQHHTKPRPILTEPNNKLNEAASGRLESDLGKNKDFGSCDNDNSEIKTYKIPRKLH